MFLDSSALVSLLTLDAEAEALSCRMERHNRRITSPMVVAEAAIGLSTAYNIDPGAAQEQIVEYLRRMAIKIEMIPASASSRALKAWTRYRKDKDEGGLNLGHCFTIAMAELYREPILYSGDTFARTDVTPA